MKEYTNDLYNIRWVGGQRMKESELWSKEVGVMVAEKGRGFEDWLKWRDMDYMTSTVHRHQ